MATYTDNYNLIKPSYSEIADVATINTNMPIWDMYVLQYLGMKVKASYKDKEERLAEIVSIYEKMQEFYKSEKAQSLVQKFNALYDGSEVMSMELSDVKKADFMIWGDR